MKYPQKQSLKQRIKSLTFHSIIYGQYTFSETNSVESFNVNKYSNKIIIEHTNYVYDSVGRIMAVICAPSKKKSAWECRKYIIQKRLGIIPVIHYLNSLKAKLQSLKPKK